MSEKRLNEKWEVSRGENHGTVFIDIVDDADGREGIFECIHPDGDEDADVERAELVVQMHSNYASLLRVAEAAREYRSYRNGGKIKDPTKTMQNIADELDDALAALPAPDERKESNEKIK